MALTICKKCGKRVSDTVEKCIHCGALLNQPEEPAIVVQNDADNKESASETAVGEPVRLESLNERIRKELEEEYLAADEWARKYRRSKAETASYSRYLFIYLGLLLLYLRALELFDITFAGPLINQTAFIVSVISLALLLGISFALLVYAIVKRVHLKLTLARYVYLKRYQGWLLKEKKIDFEPHFKRNIEKQRFDSINVEL